MHWAQWVAGLHLVSIRTPVGNVWGMETFAHLQ